jgi:hypothetical protein
MASNLYEAVMTRNARLVKFFDENHSAAAMVMKVIGMIARMANEDHFDASACKFEVFNPRGSDAIVIRILRPGV